MDRPLKVIVIEDDPLLRRLFADTLRRDPLIEASEADSLISGGRLARKERQVVILADIGLPDTADINEIMHVVSRAAPGSAVVVITGDERKLDGCLKAGAAAAILKGSPESIGDELIHTVRKAVIAHEHMLAYNPILASNERVKRIIERVYEPGSEPKR